MDYFSWQNFILGILGIALGVYVIKDAFYINHHIYFLGWAENKFGPGGGTTFYKFLGVALCVFFFFVMFGYIDLVGNAVGGNTVSKNNNSQIQTQYLDNNQNLKNRIAP